MSLADLLTACFGGGNGSAPIADRQAPYLSAEQAAQMPLDLFLERSIESAPSTMQQRNAFADIFQKHLEGGANTGHVVQVVQNTLERLANNKTEVATAQWACQLLGLAAQSPSSEGSGGYRPPQTPTSTYAQAAGSDNGGWQTQEPRHRPPQHKVNDADIYIRSYFFPSEESFHALINFIGSAQSTLDICVFNITDNEVTRAIGEAKERGVEVRIITDDEQLKCQGNDVERMRDQYGIPFKTDSDPSKFMHSKFAIIDKRAVWSGSYNWTVSARRSNNESAICTNDPSTAQAYSEEFEKLWNEF
ncbi:hypothetical protein LPJ64_000118 [Coemansia asiatica]|uniref:Mitochondrial cardiolipin hydrolase n=1 Tax=Coemansia asiatica TaxID=1052880 RepID=A0A9W7XR14_9FUNG|nr:hypothetical protein LPJ64_000118 [Coemansia asiatica]